MSRPYRIVTRANVMELARSCGRMPEDLDVELRLADQTGSTAIVWEFEERWYITRIANQDFAKIDDLLELAEIRLRHG